MTSFVDPEAPEFDEEITISATHCNAENCEMPIDGNYGGWFCWKHRRGLRLSSTITDALKEFLGTTGQAKIPYDEKIEEAGECFSEGLQLLFESIFNAGVTVNTDPIHLGYSDDPNSGKHSWRIAFWWALTDDIKAMSESENESDDEGKRGDSGAESQAS